jgi:hypothetical protein
MRQEVYRVAFDEASAELSEILGKFELLRIRKDRIEKVVEALKPLVVANETLASGAERIIAPSDRQSAPMEMPPAYTPAETSQEASSPIPYPVQQAVEHQSDPFSRRVDNAIGTGTAGRDVREYSRLFNTGLSRGN